MGVLSPCDHASFTFRGLRPSSFGAYPEEIGRWEVDSGGLISSMTVPRSWSYRSSRLRCTTCYVYGDIKTLFRSSYCISFMQHSTRSEERLRRSWAVMGGGACSNGTRRTSSPSPQHQATLVFVNFITQLPTSMRSWLSVNSSTHSAHWDRRALYHANTHDPGALSALDKDDVGAERHATSHPRVQAVLLSISIPESKHDLSFDSHGL